MRWILASVLGILCMGCVGAVPSDDAKPAPAPVVEPERWTVIPEAEVAFRYMFPKQAQKNTYVTWKRYANEKTGAQVWRVHDRDISDEAAAALEAMMAAATAQAIPAAGFVTCRYREDMPLYRVEFQRDGHHYVVVSASDCLHAAPFHAIVDGKLSVMPDGAFGQALEKAVALAGTKLPIGTSAGVVMLSETHEIPGLSAEPQEPVAKWYDARFRADAGFGAALAGFEAAFGATDLPEVACNQAKSADCADVSARYRLHAGESLELPVTLQYTGGAVQAELPPVPSWGILKKALESPVLRAWIASYATSKPLRITWSDDDHCTMVRGLATHFSIPDDKAKKLSCSSWSFSGEGVPAAVYYVGLDALWIEPGTDLTAYFPRVAEMQGKKKKIDYRNYIKPDRSTNLFVRLNGQPIAFVTRDGKTTIQ